jgi:integrase
VRAETSIRPKLGDKEVATLTTKELRSFRNAIADSRPRVRTKAGEKPKYRPAPDDATAEELEDANRARRSTANRTWTILRAALNRAYEDEEVPSREAWDRVKPFEGVDKARIRYLEVADAKRLVNAADPDFRPMLQGALLTGGRWGQLAQLLVSDFNRDAGTVRMTTRKGDGTKKVYHVHLTDEGVRFFKQACIGRNNSKALLFTKADGAPWKKSEQDRPIRAASEQAKIVPHVNFHCLRHTYASHAVMNGAPLLVVAKNLGHTDTRMVEKHYGHLAASYMVDAIRAAVPQFGFKQDRKIATITP